jgi:protein-S-isoprenylcysteine O-methyltransferase Ste14
MKGNKDNIMARARMHTIISWIVLGGALLISAGDWTWKPAWAYWAILALSTMLSLYGPLRLDKGLIQERMSRKPDAKRWDRYCVGLVALFTMAEMIVPGLDHRFGWTSPQPLWLHLLGLALAIAGTAGLMWAMQANRFFSAYVRIQKERGHSVISQGPYRIVRHPGYAFWSLRTIGIPLLFGSNWTFIVAVLFIAMFFVRTALEDEALQNELQGYKEYAEQVRWKIIRGIW